MMMEAKEDLPVLPVSLGQAKKMKKDVPKPLINSEKKLHLL